ncbi:MAG TPA: hypothetical protein VFB73_06870 [Chloroflexota bacterium]|nr:hypothetical protein [Chloroflexota bacterium]
MLQYHLTTRDCELAASDQRALQHHLEHLERQLRHFQPELVHLDLLIEHQPRRREYVGSFRLSLPGTVLVARRNRAPAVRTLLKEAFEDLEERLARYKAALRRDYAHERKRAALEPEQVRFCERVLLEERELLDRALAGDRTAFDQLVQQELPGLARQIEALLAASGREPSPEAVEHVMADVLATAFARLAQKPARWSLGGWLGWLARREIDRETRGLAVSQPAL